MIYAYDIELYKDGVSIDMQDCLHTPIAAATGFYYVDYYYYYCILNTIKCNWGEFDYLSPDYQNMTMIDKANKILQELGLEIKRSVLRNTDEMLNVLIFNIKRKVPVLMRVKYNALYYNKYYKDYSYKASHMLLFDKYNENTGIYTFRDSSYYRELNIAERGADILFPLCFTENALKDIWTESCKNSEEFNIEDMQSVYTIEASEDRKNITYESIIETLVKCKNNQSTLVCFIKTFNQLVGNQIDWEQARRHYTGSIKVIFIMLEHWLKNEGSQVVNYEEFNKIKKEYVSSRETIFNKLLKKNIVGNKLKDKEEKELTEQIKEMDQKLFQFIDKLASSYKNYYSSLVCVPINIKSCYNNEAIGLYEGFDCTADITGNGVYFLIHNEIKQKMKGDYLFEEKLGNGQFDNISCDGQIVPIPIGKYKSLQLLACSEYGDYKEYFEFCMDMEVKQKELLCVSDFYGQPKFGEKVYVTGLSIHKYDEKSEQLSFKSKIFEYNIRLAGEEINSIKLPVRKNIHIFSISAKM